MLGYAENEFSATSEAFVGLVHPDDRVSFEADIRAHLEEGKPHAMDFRVRCKNGNYL